MLSKVGHDKTRCSRDEAQAPALKLEEQPLPSWMSTW